MGRLRESREHKFENFDRDAFTASRATDDDIVRLIRDAHARWDYICDPHTACGFVEHDPHAVSVVLATAHPAKFPDAVKQASGIYPDLPARLSDLYDRPEKVEPMSNDVSALMAHVRAKRRAA